MRVARDICVFLARAVLGCAALVPACAQQPTPTSETRLPNPIHLRIPPASKTESTEPKIEQLADFASRLLRYSADAGCRRGDCKILVTDFVSSDGYTSRYAMQLADDLSSLIVTQGESVQVVDRALFKNLLQQEVIPAKVQNTESVARWMGKQFVATVVLVGQVRMIKDDLVELSGRFLNVDNKDLISYRAEVILQVNKQAADLTPTDGLTARASLPPFPDTLKGEKVFRAGDNEVSSPGCFYMPGPALTMDSISAEYSGIVLFEGVIGPDGFVREVRIVSGAPFGLNEEVLRAVKTWRCKPAMLDGKPVATLVTFEVNFRPSEPNKKWEPFYDLHLD